MSDHFSYSQINLYKRCPKRYDLCYNQNMPKSLPSGAMLAGSAKHDELEKATTPEQYPEKMQGIIARYFANPMKEQEIKIDFLSGDLIGFIDMAAVNERHGYIIDWKLNMVPEDDTQLKIYAYALMKAHNLTDVTAWFASINLGYYKSFFYTEEQLDEIYFEISEDVHALYSGNYPAQPGSHCSYCQFAPCESVQKYAIAPMQSLEQAQEIGSKLIAVKGAYDQWKELLEGYLLEKGLTEIDLGNNNRFYLYGSTTGKFGKLEKVKAPRKAKEIK